MMAFVLLLLATVLYDGCSARRNGRGSKARSPSSSLPRRVELMAVRTAGLVAFWLMFLGAYLGICAVMSAWRRQSPRRSRSRAASPSRWSRSRSAITWRITSRSCWSRANTSSRSLSDPFGYGWNLFGTAGYRVDIAIVGARFAWYTAVAAILAGAHRAVYLAHCKAMRVFEPRRAALALAGAADRADGGLHLRRPLHPGRADRRAARAGAAVAIATAEIAVPATRCCPSPGAAACSRSGRARSPGRS